MSVLNLKRSFLTVVLVVLLVSGLALVDFAIQIKRTEGTVAPGTEASIGGSFSLIDQSGRSVTNSDYADRYKLIFFGFTHCPDVCPITLSRMSQMLKLLGPAADKLYPLFITVDPERDRPERLAQYAYAFDPRIIYLTGSNEEIAKVLEAWKATRAKVASQSAADEAYGMNHSSVVYLMTPDNRLASAYSEEVSAEQMAKAVNVWLNP